MRAEVGMTWDEAVMPSQVHPNSMEFSKLALTYCVSLHEVGKRAGNLV